MVNLLPVLIGFVGGLMLYVSGVQASGFALIYPTLTPMLLQGAKLLIQRRLPGTNLQLLNAVAGLCTIGMLMLVRLSAQAANRQFLWIVLSVVVMLLLVYFLPAISNLQDYRYVAILIGLVALIVTVVFGVTAGGATSWISLGFVRVQPAELVKIFWVLFLASYLVQYREVLSEGTWIVHRYALPHPRYLGPVVVMWGLSLMLLVSQRDLGMALLFFSTFLVMFYIATGRKTYVLAGLGLLAVGGVLAYLLFGHVRIRIDTWLNPWTDVDGKGYQITQSLFALAWGGLSGTGLGLGNPGQIPAVATDFIFSALVEETGFVGAIVVVGIYLLIFFMGYRIALTCKDDFNKLFAAGLTALLTIQTFVILGGVTKLIPLTGVTLPFVSYGGSSLLTNFIIVALLLRIAHESGGTYG